jgi:large subunit ribosomal protein L16
MLMPKKVKHRKWMKGRGRFRLGAAQTLTGLDYGEFGLKSLTKAWVTSRQLEAGRRVMVRYIKKGGKIWTRVFPDKPITTKGTHFTMGSGKGAPEYFVAVVKPGTMIFEVSGLTKTQALEALTFASHKLPVKAKVVTREK